MRLILVLCFVSLLLPASLQAAIVGEARSRDGELLYTERHLLDGSRHKIEYRDADDELFATNLLDYDSGDTQPAYRQRNLVNGERQEVQWRGDKLVLFRSDGAGDEREKVISAPQPLVLSAGFDHFVRDHWEALQRGEELRFHFAIPLRLMLVELRVRRTDATAPPGGLALRTEGASAWLRLLSKPVDLLYDAERRLQRYRGISNLGIGGEAPWVDITYRYDQPGGRRYDQPDDERAGGAPRAVDTAATRRVTAQ